jgi:hypothetical protein
MRIQGSAFWRYSFPMTHIALSSAVDLRNSSASICRVRVVSRCSKAAVVSASRGPYSPLSGTTPPNRAVQNLVIRLTKLPRTSAKSWFTVTWKCSQVKFESSDSGAFARRYQRQ